MFSHFRSKSSSAGTSLRAGLGEGVLRKLRAAGWGIWESNPASPLGRDWARRKMPPPPSMRGWGPCAWRTGVTRKAGSKELERDKSQEAAGDLEGTLSCGRMEAGWGVLCRGSNRYTEW